MSLITPTHVSEVLTIYKTKAKDIITLYTFRKYLCTMHEGMVLFMIKKARLKDRLVSIFAQIRAEYPLYLMFLPVVIYYLLFKYFPVVLAFFMSLTDYDIYKGFANSTFVGLKNFLEFFNSIYFWRLLRNTLAINLLNLAFAFTMPIVFALLLNEITKVKAKRVVQSISYLPHFISTVVVASMITMFLSPSTGLVNNLIVRLGGKPIPFLQNPKYFWGIMTVQAVWRELGWGAILYIAALTGINMELYEAASIDGAGRWKQMWHVTLPGILPTIVVLFLIRLGKLLEVGYEMILLLYSPAIYETADVFSTYVYRRGILEASYSYSSAVGLFQSLVGFVLVFTFNHLSRKATDVALW